MPWCFVNTSIQCVCCQNWAFGHFVCCFLCAFALFLTPFHLRFASFSIIVTARRDTERFNYGRKIWIRWLPFLYLSYEIENAFFVSFCLLLQYFAYINIVDHEIQMNTFDMLGAFCRFWASTFMCECAKICFVVFFLNFIFIFTKREQRKLASSRLETRMHQNACTLFQHLRKLSEESFLL